MTIKEAVEKIRAEQPTDPQEFFDLQMGYLDEVRGIPSLEAELRETGNTVAAFVFGYQAGLAAGRSEGQKEGRN